MTLVATDTSPVSDNAEPVIDPATAVVENDTGAVTDANAAAPSTVDVQDAKAPTSLLDVVKSVVEKPAEPEVSSAAESKEGDTAAVAAVDEAATGAEDDANLPFHNHPRWQAMLAERNSLREPAENYGKITAFMETHGLLPDEVAEGYQVMALLKSGDPVQLAEAREWFSTRLHALDESLGNVLPDDLQQRVDEGLIDQEGAQELARTRAATALRTEQDTAREAREAEAGRARDTEAVTTAMVAAVEGWETRTKAADPDYSKKAELVQTTCRAIVSRPGAKVPTTAEEAVALADQALAEVNKQFRNLLPKPKPIQPGPASSSAITTTAPKTLREAINAAVGH